MSLLVDVIKKKCATALWSTGVRFARDNQVVIEFSSREQVQARVRDPKKVVPPSVTLYLEDSEWTCDCGSRFDPCEHIAATAIALQNQPLDATSDAAAHDAPRPHIGYRLAREGSMLILRRVVVAGDTETPLESLKSLVARGTELLPTLDDLQLDDQCRSHESLMLVASRASTIFGLLGGARDIKLQAHDSSTFLAVRVSPEPIYPDVVVSDAGERAVKLSIVRNPKIREVIARGFCVVDDRVHPLGAIERTGDRLENIPAPKIFEPHDFSHLLSKILPDLQRTLQVDVQTQRLPSLSKARPRIMLELDFPSKREPAVSVVATMVYGEPPIARIDFDDRQSYCVPFGSQIPARDEPRERRLLQSLREQLQLLPGRRVDFVGDDAPKFLTAMEAWDAQHSDGSDALICDRPLVANLSVSAQNIEFDFAIKGDSDHRATADSVLRAWQNGFAYVPLGGGGFAKIPSDFLETHASLLRAFVDAKSHDQPLDGPRALSAVRLCEALGQPVPTKFESLRAMLSESGQASEYSLPADMHVELRQYQKQGVNWLLWRREAGMPALLADDMGLGKTVQTIAAIKGRTLIVAPKSVVWNWQSELARFRPTLSICLRRGSSRTRDDRADVTITSYSLLRLDLDDLLQIPWDCIVLDESQAIKNPDSQTTHAAFLLAQKHPKAFRVALSGTPIENRLQELWSVFQFLGPGLLGTRDSFAIHFASAIERGDADAARALRAQIKPFLLRRTKREVAQDLPSRTESTLQVELEESERAVYDMIRIATKRDILATLGKGLAPLAALEALLRLRQAACHSGLVPGQHAATSSKVEGLVEKLQDAMFEGHKSLVFSQWTSLLDRIEPRLHDEEIAFTRLDGSTRDRQGVVADFQAQNGPPVMLASLKAGGTGLNLTAADHVFLMDPWWNPAAEDQAADRAHRIGQQNPVIIYRVIAKNTVEEGILALQAKKRAMSESTLSEAHGAIAITRDELLALLE